MRALMTIVIAGLGLLVAITPAAAQQVEIQAKPPEVQHPARVVPPPLHYETTKPPDHDFYPQGTKVEHDPAFIEPLASEYATSEGSGRIGISGWTAPNQPLGGAAANWSETSGWFALGFSVTWGGPPARPAAARPR